jgi:uncharacterized PurR-regulated membrane protein YhhQ (DUF165 family)
MHGPTSSHGRLSRKIGDPKAAQGFSHGRQARWSGIYYSPASSIVIVTVTVILRMAQLVLIVDLELLGGFCVLIDLAHGCLILTGVFIVSVIVVILGTAPRVLGENQTLKVVHCGRFCMCVGHGRSL